MRKTIMMLINGFGIERKDSAGIYSDKIMPNLDAMTKNYLFGSIISNAGDYNNGYRLFSMPEKKKNVEDQIDKLIFANRLGKNETIMEISNNTNNENRLHIFYYLDDGEKFTQVRDIVKAMNPDKNKTIFMHFILTSTNIENYKNIIKIVNKMSFEVAGYFKIGMVVGAQKINTDDVLRTFYREFGEHWNESEKKFQILSREVINPDEANVFYVNNGFSLKENDNILLMNFSNVDVQKFITSITSMPLKIYSLYEYDEKIKNIFVREEQVVNSFSDIIEKNDIKILLFTDQSRINDVNFYLNGMKKKISPNLLYAVNTPGVFSSKEAIIDIVENKGCDGFIIDYNIGDYSKVNEIVDVLKTADGVIKSISDAALEKDYVFIISSTFGMHAQVMDGVVSKVINFSGKVPVILQSSEFTKDKSSINSTNTYGLSSTFLTLIKDEVGANSLVRGKSKGLF